MKTPVTLFIISFLSVALARADGTATCKPSADTKRWQDATVGYLAEAGQQLYHVRANGPYLVADLICTFEKCVGFVNGIEAKGSIRLDNSNVPVEVRYQAGDKRSTIPVAEFECK